MKLSQRGQFLIESILIMVAVVFLSTWFFNNVAKEQVTKALTSPFKNMSGLSANGYWSDIEDSRTRHPNHASNWLSMAGQD